MSNVEPDSRIEELRERVDELEEDVARIDSNTNGLVEKISDHQLNLKALTDALDDLSKRVNVVEFEQQFDKSELAQAEHDDRWESSDRCDDDSGT